ncbi:Alpha/Beta hydrolase protein [Gigaspora rosea]|uniref:Alpha/Beta hydrolase protein n=1 Tax=Gigaspora rosea TaxID=44941 RepID=A0A397V9V1_9GLOM|nr:Alpha/Beta hydrolase protein [Gigaspora rosea]
MSISESPESPLVKSWDLKFQLAMEAIKSFEELSKLPIEQAQELFIQSTKIKVPSNIIVKKVTLNERYRQKSRNHLEKGLKQFEDVIDEKWKEPNDRLYGEWVYSKEEEENKNNEMDKVVLHMHGGAYYLGSAKSSRSFTIKFAVQAKARVFSIDYRLSPPNQFPAPLCDCLAAYLYLINPGPDAGFKPINPKKIVIAGESAGAGLAFSMLLFLRDAGLPLPGGAIGLVDLTHSMPSFWDDLVDKVDILPKILGGRKIWPSSPVADEYIANVKALSNKIDKKKPTIVGHPSFTKVPRFQFYCANEALAIPYASPMLAESLGDLPPILFQVGELERVRDEAIFFSFKAAFPHEYQIPSYATKNFVKSPFKNPTKVILEVYDDMPHCWHMFSFSKPCKVAFERCCDFIKRVTSVKDNNTSMIDLLKEDVVSPSILISPSLVAMRVSTNGEIKELNEADRNCLKYSKIGIVPKEAALASKL